MSDDLVKQIGRYLDGHRDRDGHDLLARSKAEIERLQADCDLFASMAGHKGRRMEQYAAELERNLDLVQAIPSLEAEVERLRNQAAEDLFGRREAADEIERLLVVQRQLAESVTEKDAEIERLRSEAEMSTKRESALRNLANGRLDEIERLRSELERRRRAIARLNWVGDD